MTNIFYLTLRFKLKFLQRSSQDVLYLERQNWMNPVISNPCPVYNYLNVVTHTHTHCKVDWSTEEDFTIQHLTAKLSFKSCKPFEVSCLVARGPSCFRGGGCRRRSTSIFVVFLAVRSPGGAAVWGHKRSLPPFSHWPSTRWGTDICGHKKKTIEQQTCNCWSLVTFFKSFTNSTDRLRVHLQQRVRVQGNAHHSSRGFVWLVYLCPHCLSPQESCTWD